MRYGGYPYGTYGTYGTFYIMSRKSGLSLLFGFQYGMIRHQVLVERPNMLSGPVATLLGKWQPLVNRVEPQC